VFAGGQLGASFFCSQDVEDRSNLQYIFPTLAVQLARKYPEVRSIIVPLVRSDPGIIQESLYNQMEKLIVQPLRESATSTIIIIDALDECQDDESTSAILSVLSQFVSQIPEVKFFLTSRPEPHIQKGFYLPLLAEVTDVFILHNVEPSLVNSDILLFLKQSFLELAHRRYGLDNWPTEEQLDLLCERAAGLFAFAVASIKFVDSRNKSPMERLERLLQTPESTVYEGKTKFKLNMTIDSLYMSILQRAFGHDDPEDDQMICSILGAVVLAANTLSPSSIATILGFGTQDTFIQLSSVHSVLILQDADFPVRAFHKSFPDFIVDSTRCTNKRFHVSPSRHHPELLIGCLKLMNQTLEKNMCKLPDAVANSAVSNLHERVEQYLSPALQYACMSWHKHLINEHVVQSLTITSTLHQFLETKFLFWLEVLSVLGAAKEAIDALEGVAKWLEVSSVSPLSTELNLPRLGPGITST